MSAVLRSSTWAPEPKPTHLPVTAVSRRYLALWLPHLPVERFRRHCAGPADQPLVLVENDRGAVRIAALGVSALAAGLRPGMALAQARAIMSNLAVAEIDRHKDSQALGFCAAAVQRFTPLVALDGDDGLMLDITGCAHLFGGEAGLLKAVEKLISRLGLTPRIAIAGTPDAAHAFARFSSSGMAQAGREESIARNLPLAALEAEAETAAALSRAGFRTLGDLAARPAKVLVARFGGDLLTRLEGIFGRRDQRITPLRPPAEMIAERHFPEPMALLQSLMAVLERLASDVSLLLERRGEGGRGFEAEFYRSDGAVRRIVIETGAPIRTPQVLMRLLRLKIEALADPIDPGFGFDSIRLLVCRSEPMEIRQDHLVEPGKQDEEARIISGLIDRLIARFGRDNVQRFVARDTHEPTRAAAIVPYNAADVSMPLPMLESGSPPTRPLTLFEHPQPIEATAEVPDGPPIRFRWRRVLHEVTRAEGPERIAPEWWRPEETFLAIRDYYRLEDARGQRFWLFREGLYTGETPARWYIHGLFA